MLTDTQIRKASSAAKAYKLTDGGGLYLYVSSAGGKLWRLKYRYMGKEKLLSLGKYPMVTLAKARQERDLAKEALRAGRDPALEKKRIMAGIAADAENTFEKIAREWHGLQKSNWTERHSDDVLHSLERDIFPDLGQIPIKKLTAPLVLAALRKIEARPALETARRARQRISAVCVYAIASGRAEADPAAIVQGAMAPMRKGRQPAITSLEEARAMLNRAEAVPAHPVTKLALRLLALTAVRPGCLITTPWREFDHLDEREPVWQIPAARLKLRLHFKDDESRDHLVPLSWQAVEVIAALREIRGRNSLVFPNTRHAHKPLSENALGYLLNRAGYHHRHVPHGWRASFSTIMNEWAKREGRADDRDIIDLMLAHTPDGKSGSETVYNRAAYLPRRQELAQIWADLITAGLRPAKALLNGPRKPLRQSS